MDNCIFLRANQKFGDKTHPPGSVKVSIIYCAEKKHNSPQTNEDQQKHTHNSLVLNKILFNIFSSVTTCPIFCVLVIKPFHCHSCLQSQESCDPSCQLAKCHTVTTLAFTSLAAIVPKSGNSKAFLIDRHNKKRGREETLHDFTCYTTVYRQMKTADVSIMPMQGFLKFWLVSSDQNIQDHLWRWS